MEDKIMTVTFKRNGNITLNGNRVGVWSNHKGWAGEGKNFWHAYLINGKHLVCYQKFEIAQYIHNHWQELFVAKRTLSEEEQNCNINNA